MSDTAAAPEREARLRDAFLDMLANLTAASCSYETFAGSATKLPERDAFFNTRSKDYKNAIVRANKAFKELFPAAGEVQISRYKAEKRAPNN